MGWRLLVGLGNPGREYEGTRHNVGYAVAGRFAERHAFGGSRRRFKGRVAEGRAHGHRVTVLLPETYMNLSGESVREAVRFHGVPPEDVLVVLDDMDLEPGTIRLRASGSAGGHRGLVSLEGCLGTRDYPRLRVGIGRPPGRMDPAAYVLTRFRKDELARIDEAVERATAAVDTWLEAGVDVAMNCFNRRPKSPEDEGRGGPDPGRG